jgi:hypothetical protein
VGYFNRKQVEAKRIQMQEEAFAEVNDRRHLRIILPEEAEEALVSDSPFITKDEYARHIEDARASAVTDEDRARRLGRLEGCVDHLEKVQGEQGKQINEIHRVVTNGLQGEIKRLTKAVDSRPELSGKKPKRVEWLLGLVSILTVLNFTGLLDPLGEALRRWINGGG